MSVHLSRTELTAKNHFIRAVEALLLDFDAEQVGRIADYVGEYGAEDYVGEYGAEGDGGARAAAVVFECLRLIVDHHGRR